MNAREVRALFPILKKRAYLFSGGIAPTTTRSLETTHKHLDYLTHNPDDLYVHTQDDLTAVRTVFAKLVHADVDEIAITEGTSAASNIAVDLEGELLATC